jgi:hypothetical protein
MISNSDGPAVVSDVVSAAGTGMYRLSAQMKVVNGANLGVFVRRADGAENLEYSYIGSTDSLWKEIAMTVTLTINPGDTIFVFLAGNYSHLIGGSVWVDLVRFENLTEFSTQSNNGQ